MYMYMYIHYTVIVYTTCMVSRKPLSRSRLAGGVAPRASSCNFSLIHAMSPSAPSRKTATFPMLISSWSCLSLSLCCTTDHFASVALMRRRMYGRRGKSVSSSPEREGGRAEVHVCVGVGVWVCVVCVWVCVCVCVCVGVCECGCVCMCKRIMKGSVA